MPLKYDSDRPPCASSSHPGTVPVEDCLPGIRTVQHARLPLLFPGTTVRLGRKEVDTEGGNDGHDQRPYRWSQQYCDGLSCYLLALQALRDMNEGQDD